MRPGLIGIFDSGVGGLTVADRVRQELPGAPFLYFGDTAHVPYGNRSAEEVRHLVSAIARHLVASGAQVLVMACNTSSALALDLVRAWSPVPVIGIIEAASRAAVQATRNGVVGVIANPLTAGSGAYEEACARASSEAGERAGGVRVLPVGCPRLVPLVEAGEVRSPSARAALLEYLGPLRDEGIDTLVLGCTHYPFLVPLITEILGSGVRIIDPAVYVVAELVKSGWSPSCPGEALPLYQVSGDPLDFDRMASRLLGHLVTGTTRVDLGAGACVSS
ncbi:MAG: glutamate racemase [Candidatus Xenobium sp.]|jgi:glutamate racemase